MIARVRLLAGLALAAFAGAALAERPPEHKKDAELVVVGTIRKLTRQKERFGRGGEMTHYAAELVVRKVERGKGARPGGTLTCTWFALTKAPSEPGWAGAGGHDYKVRKGDAVRAYLNSRLKEWDVIYHPGGLAKLKK